MLVEEAPEEHSLVDEGECKGSGGRERGGKPGEKEGKGFGKSEKSRAMA